MATVYIFTTGNTNVCRFGHGELASIFYLHFWGKSSSSFTQVYIMYKLYRLRNIVNLWMTYKSKIWVNITRVPLNIFGARTFLWYGRSWRYSTFLWVRSTWYFTPDSGKTYMVMKAMNMLREEGTGQILNLLM